MNTKYLSAYRHTLSCLGMTKWQIVLLLYIITLFQTIACAQGDTLTVRGKIENLSVRLYRQAPSISVARVNILQPNREIVKTAELQPDGSFELKIPLIYPKEECYLHYANLSVPFLAQKGVIEVIIFGDSLSKSNIPLRFNGVNANTNNQHAAFDNTFEKWLATNPEKPFKEKNSFEFWEKILVEQERKLNYYRGFSTTKDTLLDAWVTSSIKNTAKAAFFAFLTKKKEILPVVLSTSTDLDTNLLLTFAKADCYQQFVSHAMATTQELSQGSLPVEKLASMILQYVPNLTNEDSLKLTGFVEGKKAKMGDLKWLSTLFKQKEETLGHISLYELYLRKYGATYASKELDYLKGVFYTNSLYNFTTDKMILWYNHARTTIKDSYYVRSLDEIHHIESQDTLAKQQAKDKFYTFDSARTSRHYQIELASEVEVYQDENKNGDDVWDEIKKRNKGKAIYVIFWTNDEFGRRVLAQSRQLHATFPKDKVAFVYLAEYTADEDVWIENIVRSNSLGLHVKLDSEQNNFFVGQWAIERVPHCVLIDANGKYISRNAPLPADSDGWDKIWNKIFR